MASREDAKKRAGWTRVSRGQQAARSRVPLGSDPSERVVDATSKWSSDRSARAERSARQPPWPPPPRRPPGASAMSSARVHSSARGGYQREGVQSSLSNPPAVGAVLARRASGGRPRIPSSISPAVAARRVVVRVHRCRRTAAGLSRLQASAGTGRRGTHRRRGLASDDVPRGHGRFLVLVPPEETGAPGLDRDRAERVESSPSPATPCKGSRPPRRASPSSSSARSNTPLSSDFQSSDAPGRGRERGRAGTGTRTGTGTGTGTRTGTRNGVRRRIRAQRRSAPSSTGMARETTGEPWTRARVRSPRPSESLRGVTSDPPAADVPGHRRRRSERRRLAAEVGDDGDGVLGSPLDNARPEDGGLAPR